MLSSQYLSLRNEIRAFVDKIQAKAIKDTLERMEISVKNFLFPSNVAENFGYIFLGTIDGHNIKELVNILSKAKKRKGPLFLHVKTVKGKGYKFAEKNTEKFHGIAPFDLSTGSVTNSSESYSSIFGNKIKEIAERDEKVFAITAGMLSGTGLKKMAELCPERVLDTGIAEGFAVTMAAGLAISEKKPYLCIYSTFLQRGFSPLERHWRALSTRLRSGREARCEATPLMNTAQAGPTRPASSRITRTGCTADSTSESGMATRRTPLVSAR